MAVLEGSGQPGARSGLHEQQLVGAISVDRIEVFLALQAGFRTEFGAGRLDGSEVPDAERLAVLGDVRNRPQCSEAAFTDLAVDAATTAGRADPDVGRDRQDMLRQCVTTPTHHRFHCDADLPWWNMQRSGWGEVAMDGLLQLHEKSSGALLSEKTCVERAGGGV